MRTTTLPGTDLTTTRLGFGSAALMARLDRRESVRLLEVAYDSGVRHFDTARAYGYGEAESALGEFLSRHRDDVTLTTKAGMVPPRRSRALVAAKQVARLAAGRLPALRKRLRERAQTLVESGQFAPTDVRRSLETSLRELRVDSVDVLLLHECRPADLQDDKLLELLRMLVLEGKIRYFGIGTDVDSTREVIATRPQFAQIVQLRDNVLEPALEKLPALAGGPAITHTAMGDLVARLTGALADRNRRELWRRELGLHLSDREELGGLLLAYCLESNHNGIVLFSSTSDSRIRANAALAASDPHGRDRLRTFTRLVRETLPVAAPVRS